MSGQLLRVKSAKEPKPKHTHVVITFTQGGELRYVDPRTFGELFVSTPATDGTGTAGRRPRVGRPRCTRHSGSAGTGAGPPAARCPSWPIWASTRSRT